MVHKAFANADRNNKGLGGKGELLVHLLTYGSNSDQFFKTIFRMWDVYEREENLILTHQVSWASAECKRWGSIAWKSQFYTVMRTSSRHCSLWSPSSPKKKHFISFPQHLNLLWLVTRWATDSFWPRSGLEIRHDPSLRKTFGAECDATLQCGCAGSVVRCCTGHRLSAIILRIVLSQFSFSFFSRLLFPSFCISYFWFIFF